MSSLIRQTVVRGAAQRFAQQKRTIVRPPGLPPVAGEDPTITDGLRTRFYGGNFYKYVIVGMLLGGVARSIVPNPTTESQIEKTRGFIKTGKFEVMK